MNPLPKSILSIAICVIVAQVFCDQHQAKISVFQINNKKSIHVVDDKFLSFTLDPKTILHAADCDVTNATTSLLNGLSPAYLRIAGTESNNLYFQSSSSEEHLSADQAKATNLVVSDHQWSKFFKFVTSAGLDVIATLPSTMFRDIDGPDFDNAMDFVLYSSRNHFNMSWQMGYEMQKVLHDDGQKAGEYVYALRKMFEVFTHYEKSLIIGPDMINLDNKESVSFYRNYLNSTENELSAFTVHPNFAAIPENDLYERLSDIFFKMDTYLWQKDGIFRSVSKGVIPKKPIWIAESEEKEAICKFSDAMSMIKRVGISAKLGASVYLRKPHLLSIYDPTPEYWVSSLFKALVGRSVLDLKSTSGNNSMFVFSHCTQVLEKPEDSIVNPTMAYERGSITVYGVNADSEPSRLAFKIGFKMDETMHLYVLTEDSKNGPGKTMLNRQRLALSADNELPMLSPKVRESADHVVVPSRSIFFLVFPHAKCRPCTLPSADDNLEASKLKTKQPTLDADQPADTEPPATSATGAVPPIEDEPEDESAAVYVSYPKRGERVRMKTAAANGAPVQQPLPTLGYESNPHIAPKFITFSDDTWLSAFPEKMKEIEEELVETPANTPAKREKLTKIEKYRIMAQALRGKRNQTTTTPTTASPPPPPTERSTVKQQPETRPDNDKLKRLINLRISRSVDSAPGVANRANIRQNSRNLATFPHNRLIFDHSDELEKFPDPHSFKSMRKPRETAVESSENSADKAKERDSSSATEESIDKYETIRQLSDEIPTRSPVAEQSTPAGQASGPKSADTSSATNLSPITAAIQDNLEEAIITRQYRQIENEPVTNVNSSGESGTSVDKMNENAVPNIFGSVSQFPAHHSQQPKIKSTNARLKKTRETVGLPQDNVSSGRSDTDDDPSERKSDSSICNTDIAGYLKKNETSTANNTTTPKNSEGNQMVSKETEKTELASPKSNDANQQSSEEIKPFARNAKEPEVSAKGVPEENKRTKDSSKLHHPIRHRHENAPETHPTHPTHHPQLKGRTAKPTTPTTADHAKKSRPTTNKFQLPNADKAISGHRARIQELINSYLSKLDEGRKRLREMKVNNKKSATKGDDSEQTRQKRETIAIIDAQPKSSSTNEQYFLPEDFVSAPQKHGKTRASPHHHKISTPLSVQVTPTASRKVKPKRNHFEVHHQRTTHSPFRQRTTKVSQINEKGRIKLNPRTNTEEKHRLAKREFFDDLFSKAKDMVEVVSTDVQKNIGPVEKWVEDRAEEANKEFASVRDKRDLKNVRVRLEELKERRDKIRQKIKAALPTHRIHTRDVAAQSKQTPKSTYSFNGELAKNEKPSMQNEGLNFSEMSKTDTSSVSNLKYKRSLSNNDIFNENDSVLGSKDLSSANEFEENDKSDEIEDEHTTTNNQCPSSNTIVKIWCELLHFFSNIV